jgi:hypothetical protein
MADEVLINLTTGATPMFEWIGDDHASIFSY